MTYTWMPVADEDGPMEGEPGQEGSFQHCHRVEMLVIKADENAEEGTAVAMVEDFGYSIYPCALNAATGNLERHGPTQDMAAAKMWCERVAGLHPTKPGDERPPFYYAGPGDKK